MTITLTATLALAALAPIDDTTRGALALRQLVGTRVVADADTELGVDVIGSIEDILLDSATGLVARVLVREATSIIPADEEPVLRTVSFADLSVSASGRRAVSTFALSLEDFLALPEHDRERDLRDEEDGSDRRLFVATELRGLALSAADDVRIGAVADPWIDLATGRVDFVEHTLSAEGERARRGAAPWQALTWKSGGAVSSGATVALVSDAVRAIPSISVEAGRTLRQRRYRAIVLASYGVKEPDTTPARTSATSGRTRGAR